MALFMHGFQAPHSYKATTRRQFTFYHLVPRNSWYSFDWPRKDEWSQPWKYNGQVSTVVTKLTKSDLQSLPFFVFIFKIRFNGMQIKQKSLEVCITWKVVVFLEFYIFPGYKNNKYSCLPSTWLPSRALFCLF